MYISCDFLPRPCLLGSFVITFCDLSMFILRNKEKKLKQTRVQFFKILLLIQPGRRWWGYEATWKTTRGPGKLIVHLFQMWNMERPNSTIVVISTINGGMDDTDYAANIWTTEGGGLKGDPKASVSPPKIWTMGILTIAITLNVKWVYLAHLKKWSPHMWLNNLKLT